MTWFVGIDPGKSGAICALSPSLDLIEFFPMDTPAHDVYRMLVNSKPVFICLERVGPMQKGGLVSAWRFGYNVGWINGVLETTNLGYDVVTPKAWQKEVGVIIPPKSKPADKKKITAAVAKRLYPTAEIYGPKGGLLDGRADALMIAHYCMLKYK